MGSPYLNSGETIFLTGSRVVAGDISYDIMLTTERLFLIDNRNPRFEPEIILISSILSVQGGKTPANEPVITILFHPEEGSVREPMNLLFSQNPNENRKPERDDWVRALIQVSIALQEKNLVATAPSEPKARKDGGLQPAVRHWVTPERVRPLSDVAYQKAAPAPSPVIPEDVDGAGQIPVHAPAPYTAVRAPPPPKTRVIMPQIIEELLPGREKAVPPSTEGSAGRAPFDQSARSTAFSYGDSKEPGTEPARAPDALPEQTISAPEPPSAGPQPITISESSGPKPVLEPGHGIQSDSPASLPETHYGPEPGSAQPTEAPEEQGKSAPAPETTVSDNPLPAPPQSMEIGGDAGVDTEISGSPQVSAPASPEIHLTTGEGVPEKPEIPAMVVSPAALHSAEGIPRSDSTGIPVPEKPVHETIGQEPVVSPVQEISTPPQSAAGRVPPPDNPARSPLKTLVYAMVLLIVFALAAAGLLLLFPHAAGPSENPASVTVPPVPEPGTTQPAAVVEPSATPASVPAVETTFPIPPDGVWVTVSSAAYYFGSAGNPEQMQQVSGTGTTIYRVIRSDHPVQVSVQKQDNSGAPLTVAIYRNGTLISTRSVTMPMGEVSLLINPATGRPPGMDGNDTRSGTAGNSIGRIENY